MATVAGLLLVGVGVVSARAARRRMRYETWYFLHLYTYLAVALAFSHQFADRRRVHRQPPGPGRLVGAVPRRRRRDRLVPLRHPGPAGAPPRAAGARGACPRRPGVVSIVIGGRHLDELGAEAGQFFRWRFLTREPVVGVQPVLAVGGAAAGPAADHRQGPRRAQRGPGPAAARHAGRRRGPVRRDDRGPAPAAARCCSSPAASASPRCGAVRVAARRRPAT